MNHVLDYDRHDNCFGYQIQQNMIELSTKDIMISYCGFITRLMRAHDIVIPFDEETLKLDLFDVINRNLVRRLRFIVRNKLGLDYLGGLILPHLNQNQKYLYIGKVNLLLLVLLRQHL